MITCWIFGFKVWDFNGNLCLESSGKNRQDGDHISLTFQPISTHHPASGWVCAKIMGIVGVIWTTYPPIKLTVRPCQIGLEDSFPLKSPVIFRIQGRILISQWIFRFSSRERIPDSLELQFQLLTRLRPDVFHQEMGTSQPFFPPFFFTFPPFSCFSPENSEISMAQNAGPSREASTTSSTRQDSPRS